MNLNKIEKKLFIFHKFIQLNNFNKQISLIYFNSNIFVIIIGINIKPKRSGTTQLNFPLFSDDFFPSWLSQLHSDYKEK